MKVSLLTLQCIKNYGSVLQTYATERILLNYFDEVETIQFIREDAAEENMLDQWTKDVSGIMKKVKMLLLVPMANRYKHVFNTFLRKYIHLTEKEYHCDEDFKQYPLQTDVYCVGSDQVWNSSWNQGFLPAMFLEFAPDSAMKFAFCSSFGKTALSQEEMAFARPLLNRLQYISVRESTALPVLEQMGIFEGIHILDPTLLVAAEVWSEMASPRMVAEDYVLVYQLNPNPEFDRYAYAFAQRKGLKLVHIAMRMSDKKKKGTVFLMPEVEEFLSLIKHASYVITDSFHGTAFSLNFNRELIDIYPAEFSTRLHSILDWAGLLSRHLESYDDLGIADRSINYAPINEKLMQERAKAMKYLQKIADEAR